MRTKPHTPAHLSAVSQPLLQAVLVHIGDGTVAVTGREQWRVVGALHAHPAYAACPRVVVALPATVQATKENIEHRHSKLECGTWLEVGLGQEQHRVHAGREGREGVGAWRGGGGRAEDSRGSSAHVSCCVGGGWHVAGAWG